MDASDLRFFETVARLGAMNRAAAELNTVQSNVTARIRQLEDELSTPLFRRHARGVALTPAGERLLPYASRVGHLIEEAARAARDEGEPRGPLVIGSLETVAALRLSPILACYAKTFPEVDVSIQTGTTCELVDAVLARELEGAFVCGPVDHPQLEAEAVFYEDLALLTAPAITSLDELKLDPGFRIVVLRSGCSYRQRLENILVARGVPAPRILEFGTLEAIVNCVGAGLGVTLLPESLIGPVWRDRVVNVHVLPEKDARVETVFVQRDDARISNALGKFLVLAREAFEAARRAQRAAE